jgi:hypothetical protein
VGGMLVLLIPAVIGGLWISWMLGAHNYSIFLPGWLKIFILGIIGFAARLGRVQALSKFSSRRGFIFRMWFIPFLFRGTRTCQSLKLGKSLNKLREAGWNSLAGYKVFSRVRYWGGGYLNISLTSGILKRVWFLLGAGLVVA